MFSTGTGGSGSGSGGSKSNDPPEPVEPEPEIPIIRPDDFGRARRYYAMLVGINKYPSPISELFGCIKDIDRIEGWLKANVSDPEAEGGDPLHLLRLEDEQATYENIKAGFRNHLRQAKEQDVVWFHFSGHGAEDFTAEEFKNTFEPAGKDQTLVCFRSSDDQPLHLADKELAVLLDEVARLDNKGNPKKSPHIVITLDCCHSGTGTRDFEMNPELRTRTADTLGISTRDEALTAKKVRSLDSYADGFYARQWRNGTGTFKVPLADHVLLAACESVQTAGDLPRGGVFTNGLIEALEETGGEINYADLFSKTQSSVYKIRKEQNPQFEPVGNFYPYTRFLDGTPMGKPSRYEVVKEGKNWLVKCGAIHGLPVSPKSPIELEVQAFGDSDTVLGTATVLATGAQKSAIQAVNGMVLEDNTTYHAVLKFLPVPKAEVWLHGEDADTVLMDEIRASLGQSLYVTPIEGVELPASASLEVEVKEDSFVIRDLKRNRVASEGEIVRDAIAREVLTKLDKMVKWERMLRLNNEKSAIKDWVDLEMEVMHLRTHEKTIYQGTDIEINVTEADFAQMSGGWAAAFFPRLIVKETSQNLYCYLFHLRKDYSISSYEGEVIFRPDEYTEKSNIQIPLLKKGKGWGLETNDAKTESYFQLLVTTEELDYEQLLQESINLPFRDLVFDWNPMQVSEDWCSIVMRVTLTQ